MIEKSDGEKRRMRRKLVGLFGMWRNRHPIEVLLAMALFGAAALVAYRMVIPPG